MHVCAIDDGHDPIWASATCSRLLWAPIEQMLFKIAKRHPLKVWTLSTAGRKHLDPSEAAEGSDSADLAQ